MTLDEIANEHLRTINSSWDYHVDSRHDFSDVSMDKVLRLLNRIEKHQQKSFDDPPLVALQKYELIKEGKLFGWGQFNHAWGDEWNLNLYYITECHSAFVEFWNEFMKRVNERIHERRKKTFN